MWRKTQGISRSPRRGIGPADSRHVRVETSQFLDLKKKLAVFMAS